MTILCAWCGMFLYEKCNACSGRAIAIPKVYRTSPQRYRCPKGHPTWVEGQDAEKSHGICADCNERALAGIHSTKPVVSRRVQ